VDVATGAAEEYGATCATAPSAVLVAAATAAHMLLQQLSQHFAELVERVPPARI
jgi:hypothetical protein